MSAVGSTFNEERSRQIEHVRQLAGERVINRATPRNEDAGRLSASKAASKPGTATKGHEAFLKALESSGTKIEVEKASTGEKVVGRIKASDSYTISLAVDTNDGTGRYVTRVLFKHDISEFTPLVQLPAAAPQAANASVY